MPISSWWRSTSSGTGTVIITFLPICCANGSHWIMPAATATLHVRASLWYEHHGLLREAIQHALVAACYDRAAELIERAAEAAMMASEVATLRAWVEALPLATLQAHPVLCLYDAGALLLAGESTEAAEARLRVGLVNGERATVGGQMAVYQALSAILQGREVQSAMLAQRALELLPERSPFFRSFASLILALSALLRGDDADAAQHLYTAQVLSDEVGNVMNSVLARCHRAELAMAHNRLHEAEVLYREALFAASLGPQPEPVRGVPLMGLGVIAYERNQLHAAQRLLEEGIAAAQAWGQLGTIQAQVVLAKVLRGLGDPAEAEALFLAADELIARMQVPAVMLGEHAQYRRLRAALQAGDVELADTYMRAAGLSPTEHGGELAVPVPLDKCTQQLVCAQLLHVHGEARAALQLLDSLRRTAVRQGRARVELRALLAQAVIYDQLRQRDRALAAMDGALALAEASGALRIVMEAGPPLADLLPQALRSGVHPAFVEQLLAALATDGHEAPLVAVMAGSTRSERQQQAIVVLALSPRELEVLALAAQGMTNAEIAGRLTIGLSTVKTHMNQICRKLDVPNRTSAVAQARRLGWLSDH